VPPVSPPPARPGQSFSHLRIGENDVTLLRDGTQAFPAMLAAIRAAKSTLCFETYIYADDTTGRRFGEALMERARAGVEVNLLYDDWSSSVSDTFRESLEEAGVRVRVYRPVRFGRLQRIVELVKRRDHRKVLTVDGQVGFTGGLNISDHYAADADGGHDWRDTHVRLEGPAAQQLEALFLETWREVRGPPTDAKRYRGPPPGLPDPRVRILSNGIRRDRKDIRRAYLEAFRKARVRIRLTHAYFLPPTRLLKELMRASRRGVRVSIILAAATDVKLVLYAARGLYPRLLRAGVRIFEWNGRVLHAKTAVVDGHWSTVGSANLDALSLRQNLEVNAVFEDGHLGLALDRMFDEDLASCTRITPESHRRNFGLLDRVLAWLAWQIRHWM
jgi:cardiolipin synthase